MSPPERIGRYEIVMPLSTGGMGDVYLARLSGLGGYLRHVVLKTLEVGEADDDAEAMFFDEARVLGVLHHQHIAPVYDIAREDGRLVLIMDYIHGHTAHEIWQRCVDLGAALPVDFALTVVAAAAAGLHYAHTRRGPDGAAMKIVHRDVSLSNLMVGFDGAVKLIDFGIAKATNRSAQTQAGFVKGKLGYMAPEQLRGQALDARTDLFALGIVLYELTTMRRAFREESDRATVERIKNGAFVLPTTIVPDYPPELERIVARMLKLDPRERYADGETLRRELEALGHRLDLVLGDAAITEVMEQLFDDRNEPWQQRRGSRAETELDVSLEIASDDRTRPSHSPNRRAGTLRTGTQAVDALIQSLDTPPRGTPLAREAVTVPGGAQRETPTNLDDRAGTPIEIGEMGSDVVTVMVDSEPGRGAELARGMTVPGVAAPPQAPPRSPTPGQLARTAATEPGPPSALPRTPPPRPAKPTSVPIAPDVPWIPARVGWIAAAVIGAAAVTVSALSLVDDTAPAAEASAWVAPDAAVATDAAVAVDAAVATDAAADARTTVKLVVVTEPADATVTLGTKRLGKTPLEIEVEPQVKAQLHVRKSGYASIHTTIALDADVTKQFKLQRSP